MDNSCDITAPTELAIVDVFTKLIFGVEQQWDDWELSILQALRQVDHNVYMDTDNEIGTYLRALGVKEMIKLVSQVKRQLRQGGPFTLNAATANRSAKPHR
ncbi:MAG: hypothetical protein O7F73_19150 [Gammaproteobacteria bacterium]|nr:hypothetical protein [Gammaproteobacteria bacterium]